jgi:hypothetical protein
VVLMEFAEASGDREIVVQSSGDWGDLLLVVHRVVGQLPMFSFALPFSFSLKCVAQYHARVVPMSLNLLAVSLQSEHLLFFKWRVRIRGRMTSPQLQLCLWRLAFPGGDAVAVDFGRRRHQRRGDFRRTTFESMRPGYLLHDRIEFSYLPYRSNEAGLSLPLGG